MNHVGRIVATPMDKSKKKVSQKVGKTRNKKKKDEKCEHLERELVGNPEKEVWGYQCQKCKRF